MNIIEGLKLRVEGKELRQHCLERVQYHERQLAELQTSLEKAKELAKQTLKVVDQRRVEEIEEQQMECDFEVRRFTFYAEHVNFMNAEAYHLSPEELVHLELLRY